MNKLIGFSTAATLLLSSALPVLAGSDIVVRNNNSATLTNVVGAGASTGGNSLTGGDARSRTSGGNIDSVGASNTAGNTGGAVMGGHGGTIVTGSAGATAEVLNQINTNETDITATPWAVDDIRVRNYNTADLANVVGADAMSGDNTGNGGNARSRTRGGNVTDSNFGNTAGNTGGSVTAGNGGSITTGAAGSLASVVNVLNATITRITR